MLLEFGIAAAALCLLSVRRESERENENMISDQMAQQMNELFIVTNLKNSRDEYVKIADYEKTEMSRLYEVSIPLGLSYTVVAKLHDALETALKRIHRILFLFMFCQLLRQFRGLSLTQNPRQIFTCILQNIVQHIAVLQTAHLRDLAFLQV